MCVSHLFIKSYSLSITSLPHVMLFFCSCPILSKVNVYSLESRLGSNSEQLFAVLVHTTVVSIKVNFHV